MNRKRAFRNAGWLWTLTIAIAATASAQDNNYWSTAYGTKSQLLGGVVIGSPGDISAVYYNPGALALAGPAELLLAGNAYQYQKVSVANGSGPGKTLVSSSVGAVPSLFAGEVPILKEDRLAYAFLTRRSMDMEIERRTTDVTAISPIANPIFSAAEVQLHQNFTESWYGATWAHLLTPRIGIGVSPYVVVRSQHTRAALLTEGRDGAGDAAILNMTRDFDYLHFSVLARLGISGARDSLTWGITVTSPNLGVMGSGNTEYNTTLVDQSGAVGNVMGASYEQELDAHYKTPVGAGGGASYAWGKTRIHAALDWNAAVDRYTVLDVPEFTISTPSGDSAVHVVITEELKEVLNWGIGIEHRFGPSWAGYVSYHTDFSAHESGMAPSHSLTRWDLDNITVGSTLKVGRSDFAFGVSGAFAKQPAPPLPPLPVGTPAADEIEAKVTMLTLVVGWKIAF